MLDPHEPRTVRDTRGPAGSWRRVRIWPLTGGPGGASGTPAIEPLAHPAARTTVVAGTTVPPARATPVARSPSTTTRSTRALHQRGPGGPGREPQRGHQRRRVDRALARRQQPRSGTGGQARLEGPGLAAPQGRHVQAHEPVAGGQLVQHGPVVGVQRHHQRPVGPVPDRAAGGLRHLGGEAGPVPTTRG